VPDDVLLTRKNGYSKFDILVLPAGHLGLHFSDTIPSEIERIEDKSPIFDSSIEHVGRMVFRLSIPNKIEIQGAIDGVTLDTILNAYSDIPNRVLIFKNRGEILTRELTTTTVLPTGPVHASFRRSRGLLKSQVYVERAPPNMNFEFPVGHLVKEVIIPNRDVGSQIQTTEMLRHTLDRFENYTNRKIVFQKVISKGKITTKITTNSKSKSPGTKSKSEKKGFVQLDRVSSESSV